MQEIGSSNSARPAHSHGSENSRRPGTAGHPGKHLGQFKQAGIEPDQANQPLIEQQLRAMNADAPQTVSNNDAAFDIQLAHLQDTGDAIADQIAFTSRTQAISTAFF